MSTRPAKQLSPVTALILKTIIGASMILTLGITTLYFIPGLSIIPVALGAPTSPYCDLWQAVGDANVKLRQSRVAEEILAQSKPIKVEDGLKLWSTPDGEYWVPDTSDNIVGILLAQQRRKIYGDADTGGVRPGDIVLDGGAHVGIYVRTALDAGAEIVVAIDPSPEALESLRRNFVDEIAAGKVIVYPKGLWDEEKQLVLYSNGNGAAGDSFLVQGDGAKVIADIPVTTIDRLVKELGLPRVDIIKADVKGAGERMIHGAVETITAYHPRVIVSTEEAPEDPAAIHAAVMEIDDSYQYHCGPCLFTGEEIRTDVIFFE